jgi:uncharacterized membrane protein YccC
MAMAASVKTDRKISTDAMDDMPTMNLSDYEILRGKDPHFLNTVSTFLTEVASLPEAQKKRLALYKAAELLNAMAQIREHEEAESRIGPAKAAASRRLARRAIRDRCIDLPNGESISLGNPQIKAIIDQGSKLFHSGRSDPEQWNRAMALSTAQCIALRAHLEGELHRFAKSYADIYPDALVQDVQRAFIEPYRT